jgi:large subunit ribosomal protein L21
MYAVIQTGGKQYKVKKGDAVQVELLPLTLGATMNFSDILMVGGTSSEAKIGQPTVAGASVSAEVVAIEKGPKIIIYKKKPSKQNDKKTGHRQPYTRLLITMIDSGAGEKDTLSAEEKKTILGRVGFASKDAWAIDSETTGLEETAPTAKKKTASSRAPGAKAASKSTKAPAKKAAASGSSRAAGAKKK